MSTKAIYRPMTDEEKQRALALSRCTLPPATMTKRFARDLKAQAEHSGEITDKQAAYLLVAAYRFRRQMPKELVPTKPPPGYTTPSQVRAEIKRGEQIREIALRLGHTYDASICEEQINDLKEQLRVIQ